MKINATFDSSGYLLDFATVGSVKNGITIDLPNDITEDDLYLFSSCIKYDAETQSCLLDSAKREQLRLAKESDRLNHKYIPSQMQSIIMIGKMMLEQLSTISLDDTSKLQFSGLYEKWELGKYSAGDIRNYAGQTWECFQNHDNSVYPDIRPDNPAWYTFWRPLHGTSVETARPFVPVQGAHDMYRAGEYTIFTDSNIYRCKFDTNFSPADYPDAWEYMQAA